MSIIELSTNDWNVLKLQPQRYITAVEVAKEAGYQTIEYALLPRRSRPT